MTEDEQFNELEARIKEHNTRIRAHAATAEFIASQTIDTLAITTLRKAFEYGYRTGFRDAIQEKR